MNYWQAITDWALHFGAHYGVNPLIFALLYFGTIPFSLLSFALLLKNHREQKPIALPVFGAFACYIGTYIYLFISGKNIPFSVYLVIFAMLFYGGTIFFKKVKKIRTDNK